MNIYFKIRPKQRDHIFVKDKILLLANIYNNIPIGQSRRCPLYGFDPYVHYLLRPSQPPGLVKMVINYVTHNRRSPPFFSDFVSYCRSFHYSKSIKPKVHCVQGIATMSTYLSCNLDLHCVTSLNVTVGLISNNHACNTTICYI